MTDPSKHLLVLLAAGLLGCSTAPILVPDAAGASDATAAADAGATDAGATADTGIGDAGRLCLGGGDAGYRLSVDDVRVTEGNSGLTLLTFTITLDPAAPVEVTVDYSTADGDGPNGARAGEDYTAASGTLRFAPGVTRLMVAVSVLGDQSDEAGGERFTLQLCNPSNGAGLADGEGEASLIDDDPADGTRNELRTYVEVSDGTRLAVIATFPDNYRVGRRYPARYQTSGYTHSVYAPEPDPAGNYVRVEVSARGTGCSGGLHDLWSPRDIQDHYDIIEDWLVAQPWSNQRVAITGHSYWGNMGFRIAALNPPHVQAAAVSGLIDDLYRGITHIGHVTNSGFVVTWLSSPIGSARSGEAGMAYRGNAELAAGDTTCRDNTAARPQTIGFSLLAQVLGDVDDGPYFQSHSLATYAPNLRVPIHLRQAYQDEQTGGSGAQLFARIPATTPKRLALSNGRHDSPAGTSDAEQWLDCWMLHQGTGCAGDTLDASKRVRLYFDNPQHANPLAPSATAADYPLPDTVWQALYLRAGKTLSATPPSAEELPDTFATETGGEPFTRLAGTDSAVSYTFPIATDAVLAGPLMLDLHARVLGADADLFVELVDQFPDGTAVFLQSGALRVTERAVDVARSVAIPAGELGGELVQPHHPHTPAAALPVPADARVRLQIGLWTLGHVFRAGHSLVLRVSSPPLHDRITGTYQYSSELPSVRVELLHGPGHASRLLVPWQPTLPVPPAGANAACGKADGLPCTVVPADPGVASTETAGCLVRGDEALGQDRTCSFVAAGNHRFTGYSPNAASIRVCRAGVVVATLPKVRVLEDGSAGHPLSGSVSAEPGDTIEARLIADNRPDSDGRGGLVGTSGFIAVGNPSAGSPAPTVRCP